MTSSFQLAWAGEQPLIKQHCQLVRYNTHRHVIGNVPDKAVIFAQQGYIEKYFDAESIRKIREDGKKLLEPEHGGRILAGTREILSKHSACINAIAQHLDDPKLPEMLTAYETILIELFAYFFTSTEFVTHHLEQQLKTFVHQHDDFLTLTTPTENDLLHKEKESLLLLLKEPSETNLNTHMQNYPFLYSIIDSEQDARKLLMGRLSQKGAASIEAELLQSEQRRFNIIEQQAALLTKYSNPEVAYITNLLKQMALHRLELKAAWSGMFYSLLPLFKKVSSLTGHDTRDILMFYTLPEIAQAAHGCSSVPDEKLQQRKKAYLYHYHDQIIDFFIGDDALRKKEELLPPISNPLELHGMVACKGKVTGRAKIIKTDDLRRIVEIAKQLTKEHILIVSMTNPNMTPIIEKAGGIVTNEGGIACHAAIISREFNIPCVIGTGVATKVIQDGDMVEVNADNGTVRKITRPLSRTTSNGLA